MENLGGHRTAGWHMPFGPLCTVTFEAERERAPAKNIRRPEDTEEHVHTAPSCLGVCYKDSFNKKTPSRRYGGVPHAYLPKGRFPNHSVVHSSILNLRF